MKKKLPERRWMSLWRHFYNREKTVDQLTSSMIEWQEKWNWDFLKLTLRLLSRARLGRGIPLF